MAHIIIYKSKLTSFSVVKAILFALIHTFMKVEGNAFVGKSVKENVGDCNFLKLGGQGDKRQEGKCRTMLMNSQLEQFQKLN